MSALPLDLPHVVIAGQFPPPVMGFTYITQEMAKLVASRYETTCIDLSPHRKRGGISYHLTRLWLTLLGYGPLMAIAFKHSKRIFYVACEGRLGLLYTIKLAALARMLRYRIYVHHHNFNYIDSYSWLMAMLLFFTGPKTTHIFLCETMGDQFAARYSRDVRRTVLSNSAFVMLTQSSAPQAAKRQGDPLVIGLLSNLNDEKGLSLFLDVLRRAREQGMNLKGFLAGPPDGEREQSLIDAATQELGDMLRYFGPIYAEAKQQFFREIDMFVFPTGYANEAQPTVIFEAMACGVPVLSFDRGCIVGQVGRCGATLPRDGDFVPFALAELARYEESREDLARLKAESLRAFAADRTRALARARTLFEA